jgi:DNA-directed RNA polymerase alpha subunit
MLRKTLLSHLPGVAISSLRIEGASDEAGKLPGVEESITELLLNVKQLRLRSSRGEQRALLHLDVQGSRLVTAADLVLPEGIEMLTPGVHLATVRGTDAHLVLDLEVTHGKGYVPAEMHHDVPAGFLPVDTSIPLPERSKRPLSIRVLVSERTMIGSCSSSGPMAPETPKRPLDKRHHSWCSNCRK